MDGIILKCSGCGSSIDVDANKEIAFCAYCGAKNIVPRQNMDNVIVRIDVSPQIKIMSARAISKFKSEAFYEAFVYADAVLMSEPENIEMEHIKEECIKAVPFLKTYG